MGKELATVAGQSGSIIPAVKREQVLALDGLIRSSRSEMAQAELDGNDMLIAFTRAEVMQQLRTQLVALLPDIKHLVGTPLGVEVYPPTAKYSDDVIVDAVLEGLLKGARLVGGEIGIHSGRYYDTKKYWERMVRTYPGIVCEEPVLGTPQDRKVQERDYAYVNCKLSWRINGRADSIERINDAAIFVIRNKGMGDEAVHGKVKRRLYRMAYAKITNTQLEDDDDVIDGEIVPTPDVIETTATPTQDEPAAVAKRRVEDFMQDVEGTLCSLDSVIDCGKAEENFKQGIVTAHEAGQYTEGEAASLVKVVVGLVESRCAEIRKARGQRKTG